MVSKVSEVWNSFHIYYFIKETTDDHKEKKVSKKNL